MKLDITIRQQDRIDARFDGLTVATAQDGSAPAPFDLYLAAVGTCSGFYLSRFCNQRAIPTDGIRITQEDVRHPETGHLTRIDLAVLLPERFPAKYRRAALRAMEHCSVKKSLASPPEIRIRPAAAAVGA